MPRIIPPSVWDSHPAKPFAQTYITFEELNPLHDLTLLSNPKLRKQGDSWSSERLQSGIVKNIHFIEIPADRFNVYAVLDANEVRDPYATFVVIFCCTLFFIVCLFCGFV